MKKIVLISIALLIHLHVIAQQKPISEVANITLPKEANKMTMDEATNYVHNNFKHIKLAGNYNNIYSVGGIVMLTRDDENAEDYKLTLEQHKKMTEDFNKRYGDNIIESKIITVNGTAFFVFEDQDADERTLSFTCDFRNKKVIYCALKYKITDEAKAQKIFNNLMNSFRYKN